MSDLGLLAVQRAGLPDFAGASYQEKLENGRQQALAALGKYVPNLTFDPAGADTVLRQVQAWEERNTDRLEAAFADPSMETLTSDMALSLSQQTAQAFIVACYTRAAYGLGPWKSDLITTVSPTFAQTDAETRLQIFGGIVKMDQDGFLAQLYNPSATSGFGDLGIGTGVLIAIVIVGIAAVVACFMLATQRLDDGNRIMQQLCKDAQTKGNQDQIDKCIEASANLQTAGLFPGMGTAMGTVLAVAGIVAALWVGFQFLPRGSGGKG